MARVVRILARLRRRPYCFPLRRMRIVWRQVDRHYDGRGRPANLTVASSRARRDWADLLYVVMEGDVMVRVRHQHRDEPAIMIAESRFRELERLAADRGRWRTNARGDVLPPL